jgi:hypothetical protein
MLVYHDDYPFGIMGFRGKKHRRPLGPDQFLHELHKFRLCMRDEPLDACALAWPNAGKMLRCQKDGEIMESMEYIGI